MAVQKLKKLGNKRKTQEAEQAVKKSTKKIKNMKTQLENVQNILAQQKGFARVHQDLATRLSKVERERDEALHEATDLQERLKKDTKRLIEESENTVERLQKQVSDLQQSLHPQKSSKAREVFERVANALELDKDVRTKLSNYARYYNSTHRH